MSFTVNAWKSILGAACCTLFVLLGIGFVVSSLWILAVLCFLLGAVYGWVFLQNACRIQLGEETVERRLFGRPLKCLTWTQVGEVGVVGLKLFGPNKKRVGTRYIYFAPEKMTEEQRFNMCLKWPPKEGVYMRFSPQRLQAVKERWKIPLAQCNAGEIEI
ncbi:MAG: hypothetical protein LIO42_05405 [Oscillospiraceae bacterium]|nr:hypothetical protein [Oscillospiraceae bacterium]